jgi:hypothetical protein
VCGERLDGIVEREADGLQLAGEADALDGLGHVVAVARLGAGGGGEDADALVEPDGVDGHAGLAGDLADLHARRA